MAQRQQPTVRAHLREQQDLHAGQAKNLSDLSSIARNDSNGTQFEKQRRAKDLSRLANQETRRAQSAQIMAGDFVHEQKAQPVQPKKQGRQGRKNNARVQGG